MEALKKSLKELLRLTALTLVSWALTEGVQALVATPEVSLSPEMKLVVIGGLTSLLKGVDKFLHELGKQTESHALTMGLTRF